MRFLHPASAAELAEALRQASSARQTVQLHGANSKSQMAGAVTDADVVISSSALNRLLQYEPNDLTISVGSGMPFAELSRVLAQNAQMVPLDPPFHDRATVGGVIAANTCGSRRRLYGTARDLVIGMTFVTLEGKLVQSGGMVVKNVAGLDMAKLMIGSFGTLAAIATVNLKLAPIPPREATFVQSFASAGEVVRRRDQILTSVLQPSAIDVLNPSAAVRVGLHGYVLLLRAGGSEAVIARYAREVGGEQIDNEIWDRIREFTPHWMKQFSEGAVVRLPGTLSDLSRQLSSSLHPVVARAGSGVAYRYYEQAREAEGLIEFAPATAKENRRLWPEAPTDFAMMEKIKHMFDPHSLLNRGRLYGRI